MADPPPAKSHERNPSETPVIRNPHEDESLGRVKGLGKWLSLRSLVAARRRTPYDRAMVAEASSSTAVVLRRLSPENFESWRSAHLETYSTTLQQRLGLEPEQAAVVAEDELARALPEGLSTVGAHLAHVIHGEREVGTLWWGVHPRRPDAAFVFDIEISPSNRGRGLGRAAMVAAERDASAAGMTAIGLSVSGDNMVAQGLYESLGYSTQSISMLKPLTHR